MATEKTIVGVLHSPADTETGERKTILLQTTVDQVIDPSTGKTLRQINKENTYSDATETDSGLMSPQQVTDMKNLLNDSTVISATDPKRACMWYQIEDIEEES